MGAYRFIDPLPGMAAWAHGELGHFLPAGLPHKARVQIVERTGTQGRDVIVLWNGQRWQVYGLAIDAGREWQTASGDWIPESDERVHRWLARALVATRNWENVKGISYTGIDAKLRIERDLEWVLERNGWAIPPHDG